MPSGTRRCTFLSVRRASAVFMMGVASCAAPPTSDGADSLPGVSAAAEPTETPHADARLRAPGALRVVAHAFNDVSGSNDAIAAVLGHPDLPDTLDLQLREVQTANHLRRHEYSRGLMAADSLIERHKGRAGDDGRIIGGEDRGHGDIIRVIRRDAGSGCSMGGFSGVAT
jgi:hypothetical protein